MSQSQLATAADVTRSWVASVNTGKTVRPAPDKLARVAAVLGLDVKQLLAQSDQLGAAPLVTAPPSGDQSDVAAAIRDQTAVMQLLFDELRAQREQQPEWVEALVDVLATVRDAIGSRASSEQPSTDAPRRRRA